LFSRKNKVKNNVVAGLFLRNVGNPVNRQKIPILSLMTFILSQIYQKKVKTIMYKNIFLLLFGVLLFVTGCGDSAKPKDLPELYPVTITVTSEGKPLENAVVDLVADPPLKFQAITGTDANGKAVMKTYNYNGVPVGKFKVVITRDIDDDFVYTQNSDGSQGIAGSTRYKTLDIKFSKADTTPFEIEVPLKSGQNTTFDVGKTVKIKL
jgi:hypothetical protein